MTNQEAIEKYADLVHYIALNRTSQPSDADDVFQEVFFRYIEKSPKFRDEEHGKAWFIRVTINVCNSMFRQVQKQISFDILAHTHRQDLIIPMSTLSAAKTSWKIGKQFFRRILVHTEGDRKLRCSYFVGRFNDQTGQLI